MNAASKTKPQANIPANIALECKTSSISDGKGKAVRSRVTIGVDYIELLIKELENHAIIKQFAETYQTPLRAMFHSPSWGAIPAMMTMRAIAAPDVPKTDAVKLNVNVKNGVHGLEGLLVISGTTTGEKLKNLEPAKLLSAVIDVIKKLDERQWTEVTKELKVESKPTKDTQATSVVVPIFAPKAAPAAVKPNTKTEDTTMVAKSAVTEVPAAAPALSLQAAMALVTEQARILARRDALVLQIQERTRIENENTGTLQSLSQEIADNNARIAEITAQVDQLILEQEKLAQSVKGSERKHHEMTLKSGGSNLESLEKELAALPQFTPVEEAFIRPYIQQK